MRYFWLNISGNLVCSATTVVYCAHRAAYTPTSSLTSQTTAANVSLRKFSTSVSRDDFVEFPHTVAFRTCTVTECRASHWNIREYRSLFLMWRILYWYCSILSIFCTRCSCRGSRRRWHVPVDSLVFFGVWSRPSRPRAMVSARPVSLLLLPPSWREKEKQLVWDQKKNKDKKINNRKISGFY